MVIKSIEFLSDVRDKRVNRITIEFDKTAFGDLRINDLNTVLKDNPGKTPLYINIHDREHRTTVKLLSKNNPVELNNNVINCLESLKNGEDGTKLLSYAVE